MTKIFPSILPESETLTPSEVREIFGDDYRLIRQAAVVINENSGSETPINGKSNKLEILEFMAGNLSQDDLQTIKTRAMDRKNE